MRSEIKTEYFKDTPLENGKRKFVVSTKVPLHYKDDYEDDTEVWKDINPTPVIRGGQIEVDNAPYLLTTSKGVSVEYKSRKQKKSLGISLEGAREVRPEIDGDTILWREVFDDVDAYIVLSKIGVSFFLKLKTKEARKSFTWNYIGDDIDTLLNAKVFGFDADERKCNIVSTLNQEEGGATLQVDFLDQVVAVKDKTTRVKEWTDKVSYPVLIDPTINESIASDTDDDGVGYRTGTLWRSNGYYNQLFTDNHPTESFRREIGLRFTTIDIAQGATIDSATLTVEVVGVSGTGHVKRVYGDDVDDAPAFSSTSLPNDITRTTSYYAITNHTTGVKNLDVTSIVQEIIDRVGWSNNNDMRFLLQMFTSTTQFWGIADTGHASAAPATLEIVYTEAGGGFTPTPMMHMMAQAGGLM